MVCVAGWRDGDPLVWRALKCMHARRVMAGFRFDMADCLLAFFDMAEAKPAISSQDVQRRTLAADRLAKTGLG